MRRQLAANIARETAIISELKSLNSAFVPEVSAQLRVNGGSKDDDSGSFTPFFLSFFPLKSVWLMLDAPRGWIV